MPLAAVPSDPPLTNEQLARLAARLVLPWPEGEGLWVFPVAVYPDRDRPGKWRKTPCTEHGHLNATNEPAEAYALFRAARGATHVSALMGTRPMLFAIDVDVGGIPWLRDNYGRLHDTLIHRTGSGGYHLIYRLPGPPAPVLGNSAGKLAPGVDTRGEGGALVWAGPRYAVTRDIPPQRLPKWILNALTRKPPEPALPDHIVSTAARLKAVEDYVRDAQIGERNTTAFWGACRAGEMVRDGLVTQPDAIAVVARAAMRAGLGEIEAWRTAKSGVAKGIAEPRGSH